VLCGVAAAFVSPQPHHGSLRKQHHGSLRKPRSSGAAAMSDALSGSQWKLNLDVGVEPGTWMPPTWGRSGHRCTLSCEVEFEANGRLRLLETGAWDHLTVKWVQQDDGTIGGWSVDGERATIFLEHEGLERKDISLEAGRIYGTAGCWGSQLGRKGNLTIKQRKLGWLPFLPAPSEASFLVGRFRTVAVTSGEENAEE